MCKEHHSSTRKTVLRNPSLRYSNLHYYIVATSSDLISTYGHVHRNGCADRGGNHHHVPNNTHILLL